MRGLFFYLCPSIVIMPDQSQQPNQLNIEISEEVAEGSYATWFADLVENLNAVSFFLL